MEDISSEAISRAFEDQLELRRLQNLLVSGWLPCIQGVLLNLN
jgi:hypothetical protein